VALRIAAIFETNTNVNCGLKSSYFTKIIVKIYTIFYNDICNTPFNLIYKIKGSVTIRQHNGAVLEFKTQLLTTQGTPRCPKDNWIKSLQKYIDPRINKYMSNSPKEKPNKETKVQSTWTMRQNHHLPVVHGCSSHLLTSTS